MVITKAESDEEDGDVGGLQEEQAPAYRYLGVQVDNKHQHRGCVQEGPELAQLPQEAQVLQCMQPDSPDVLSVCCGEHHLLCCVVLRQRHQGKEW